MVVTVCCEQPLSWSADLDWWTVQHAPGCTSRWQLQPPGPRVQAARHCARCDRLIGAAGRLCDSCLAEAAEAVLAAPEPVMVAAPEPVRDQVTPSAGKAAGPPVAVACAWCGLPFTSCARHRTYCSDRCRQDALVQRQLAEARDRDAAAAAAEAERRLAGVCLNCAAEVPPASWHRPRSYCSGRCQNTAQRRRARARQRQAPHSAA